MSFITLEKLKSIVGSNIEDVLAKLKESETEDVFVYLPTNINPNIPYSGYLKLSKELLDELEIKLKIKEIDDKLNPSVISVLHARSLNEGGTIFLTLEELKLPDLVTASVKLYQTYCLHHWGKTFIHQINVENEKHPMHPTYYFISQRPIHDKVRQSLTITQLRISSENILVKSDCKLIVPKKEMTAEETIYSMYPCLDPNHSAYNPKLAFALNGNKAIVTEGKYRGCSGFGKAFQKYMSDEKENHQFDLEADDNMIKNMGYVASPYKPDDT